MLGVGGYVIYQYKSLLIDTSSIPNRFGTISDIY